MHYLNGMLLGTLFCFATTLVMAGDIDSPAGPTEAGSAMYTMQNVYNRIDDGEAGTKRTTTFGEPSSGPGSTGKTLNDLYDLASERSRPAKTGQTILYATGDDGDLEKGVARPNPRFTDNTNGTVTDNLTGLIWLKDANAFGSRNWATALADCNTLKSGEHGLTDGSSAGDWRLPNVKELQSLIDFAYFNPALSNAAGTGHWAENDAFSGVESGYYYSSTTYAGDSGLGLIVKLNGGRLVGDTKDSFYYVWPVRGGQ